MISEEAKVCILGPEITVPLLEEYVGIVENFIPKHEQ